MEEIWTTVHGGWGDAIASYCNIRALLEKTKVQNANVVFFGMDTDIISFLKAQKNIGKVIHLEIADKSKYYEYSIMGILDYPLFARLTGIYDQYPNINPTHVSDFYQSQNQNLCHRYFDLTLPPSKYDWTEVLPKEPFLLLQPFSSYSCKMNQHWPHWIKAIDYILEKSSLKVVLVGQLRSMYDDSFLFPWIEHKNLINIVGQTPSMIDVLHIMNKSVGVITTSNALSMWSIVSNKSALVMCNQIIDSSTVKYYYNWINHSTNQVLNSDTNFPIFCTNADAFMKRISCQ